VDGDEEGRAGYSGSGTLLFGDRMDGSAWMSGAAGCSVGPGLESLSLMRTCSMLITWGRGSRDDGHPVFASSTNTHNSELYVVRST